MIRPFFSVLVVPALAAALSAGERASPDVRGLVADLGSADFTRREAAMTELLALGEAAGEELQHAAGDSPDAEIRARATELLGRIGWASPADRVRITALVGKLKAARDPRAGAEAFEALKGMGKPGQKALRSLFPEKQPAARLSVEMKLDRRTFRRGESVVSKAVVKNAGTDPVWLKPSALGFSCEPVVEERVEVPGGRSTIQARVFPRQAVLNIQAVDLFDEEPGFDLVHLAPGETFEAELCLEGDCTDVVGPLPVMARYYAAEAQFGLGLAQALQRAALEQARDAVDEVSRDETPVVPVPTATLAQSPAERIHILPREGGDPGVSVSMELVGADGACAAGGTIPIEITILGTLPDGVGIDVAAKDRPPAGAWAALLDDRGEVVQMVRWGGTPGVTRLLKKGEVLRAKAAIPAPKRPGTYRLSAGFSAESAGARPAVAGGVFILQVAEVRESATAVTIARPQGDAIAPERAVTVK